MQGVEDETGAVGHYVPWRVVSGTLGALNDSVVLPLEGRPAAGFYISASDLNGTLRAESTGTAVGGVWVPTSIYNPFLPFSTTLVLAGTGAGVIREYLLTAGMTHVRLTVIAYTSGSATVTLRSTWTQGSHAVIQGPGGATTAPWHVKEQRAGTPVQTSVAASASSVTLLASNINRLGATIYNDPSGSAGAALYAKLGATASTTSFTVRLAPDGYYEVPFSYTGIIDGIWTSAAGNARITELSA